MAETFDDSKEEKRQQQELTSGDIAAARDRAEDTAGEGESLYEDGFTIKTLIGAFFRRADYDAGSDLPRPCRRTGLRVGGAMGDDCSIRRDLPTLVPAAFQARDFSALLCGGRIGLCARLATEGFPVARWGISSGTQYFVQTPQAAAIAHEVPTFATPGPGSAGLALRTFWHPDWAWPFFVLVASQFLERVSWIPAGYILFRATSDVERLPFPLASVAASGATALAEASSKEESWRWQIFSTGTTIGLVFGAIYTAIPVFTGVAFGTALTIIPIPFVDLMSSTESILPAAAPFGISGNLGSVLVGFILPFEMVVGVVYLVHCCQSWSQSRILSGGPLTAVASGHGDNPYPHHKQS